MKKNLFLTCALAFLGLCVSCQKGESSPEQVQAAEELNVITVDTQSDKAELEPLLVLGEELLGINLEDRYVEKETPLVIRVLREFFQSVGNFIGGNDQTPKHSFKYFGNRNNFGLAVDQIRELSYNFTESDVPYLRIQLGDAASLKIGSLEVMPVSNFYLDIQGYNRFNGKASLGREMESGHAEVLVSDALFVKFGYEGNTYAFTIYAEDSESSYVKSYPTDWSVFGFIFGRYEGPTLMEWYQSAFPIETEEIIPISLRAMTFPVIRNVMLTYSNTLGVEHREIVFGDTGFSSTAGSGNIHIEIYRGDKENLGGNWMEASLYSDDVSAVRDLWHDYLWASVFGCTQSQCRALSAEFAQTFDETNPECNTAHLNHWYEFEGKRLFEVDAPLALVPRAASGMVWKPALGLKLTLGDGSTMPVSFVDFDSMDSASKWELQNLLNYADSDSDGVPDYLDKCPGTPAGATGKVDENGCPLDSDGDGVPDYLDKCPGTAAEAIGMVDMDGCPLDSDGDGVPDYLDKCPGTPAGATGKVDENGCPLDSDSDGVYDYEDLCPFELGIKENKGCPEVK